MSFDLVRAGFPNMAVVAVLAALPLISMAVASTTPRPAPTVSVEAEPVAVIAALPALGE